MDGSKHYDVSLPVPHLSTLLSLLGVRALIPCGAGRITVKQARQCMEKSNNASQASVCFSVVHNAAGMPLDDHAT